jgi:hypothetical protein
MVNPIDFIPTTSKILGLIQALPKVANSLYDQAQKNERIDRILQQLNLAPIQGSDNVEVVYAYALVEYGVSESFPILELLRDKEVKDDFWGAYTNNNIWNFLIKVEDFLKNNTKLKEEIRKANIELAVELEKFSEIFISYAKRTTAAKFKINGSYPDVDFAVIPTEFRALIEEKTGLFCGRRFVVDAFDKFLRTKSKGYFTVIGDAGMGKSAIASKYVLATKFPCFFNILAEGRNKPEKFLSSIREQLIKRYGLQNQDNANLQTVLQKASEKLSEGQQLIIVVDALDEVEQEGSGNLLDLPQNLPNGVYFLLTRRPYNQQNRRLTTSPDTTYETLDLKEEKYQRFSEQDVKQYIGLFLQKDKDYKDKLKKWLQERDINELTFIEEVAKKSENNFMYLRYVLPAIANGQYEDLKSEDFPIGLEGYYYSHWAKMNMQGKNKEIEVFVLFVLLRNKISPTIKIITETVEKKEEFQDIDQVDVKRILDKWVEYLSKEKDHGEVRYKIYHASFADFLKKQSELDANRKIFRDVINSMNQSTYLNENIRNILQS